MTKCDERKSVSSAMRYVNEKYDSHFKLPLPASVELYEGKTQTNSTVWSSLDAPPMPLVERQSYVLPVAVATMQETITEKGITNKHILCKYQFFDYFGTL